MRGVVALAAAVGEREHPRALVVAVLTDSEDVAFGSTVSGRNAGIAGMERLVGYFSNAVPVRVEIDLGPQLEVVGEDRPHALEAGDLVFVRLTTGPDEHH